MTHLDKIDVKLLALLQADGRLTNVELADAVGLSASPCLRRIRRLESDGIIRGYRAVIDRARVGLGLTVFVGVRVERHQDSEARAFTDAVTGIPDVISCYLVSGESDFLLEITVADLPAYERFLTQTLLKIGGVRDIRTSFAISTYKQAEPLPLQQLSQD